MSIVDFVKDLSDSDLLSLISQSESKMNHLRKNCGLALFEKSFDPDCIREYLEEYELEHEKWKAFKIEYYDRTDKKSISQLTEDKEE